MKVCIVGAAGKLGKYMVQHALDRGYEVVGACREQGVAQLAAFKGRMTVVPEATNDREVIRTAMRTTLTMKALAALAVLATLLASPVRAEQIVGARYADPVERYGHYALGRPHEYARVIRGPTPAARPCSSCPARKCSRILHRASYG